MPKIIFFLISIFFINTSVLADNDGFVVGTSDVPLFEGMKNVESSLVVFDKPDGRIVFTETEGDINLQSVKDFYLDILPNLGWKMNLQGKYLREKEYLEISFDERDGKVIVKIILLSKI